MTIAQWTSRVATVNVHFEVDSTNGGAPRNEEAVPEGLRDAPG
jgi:hypothetical protein